MVKVHITLVGGQTAPVYNGIIDTNPDNIILIHSEDTKKEAERIKKEVSISCELIEMKPADLDKIFEKIKYVKSKINNDDFLSLNLIGGTKFWALAFYAAFNQRSNTEITLVDQNNRVWNFADRTNRTVDFDMDTHFRLYGNKLDKYRRFSDYTTEDKNSAGKVEQIRKYNYSDFNTLTTVLRRDWDNNLTQKKMGKFELDSGSYVEWKKPDFVRICLQNKKKGIKEIEIKSPNAVNIVFHAGWFEYKVAQILSCWSSAKEIRLNCLFPYRNLPKNETDIIVNTGSKILFVECKTQIKTTTDIDKFRTVVANYGGMGSKALFVTESPMTDMALEKCSESDILTFSLGDNQQCEQLYSLLDKEINSINKK